jgi:hypothetical protein
VPHVFNLCRSDQLTRTVIAGPPTWNFTSDLEGWIPSGTVVHTVDGGRTVARMNNGTSMSRTVLVPSGTPNLEIVFSADDRAGDASRIIVDVTGPLGSAVILDVVKTTPSSGLHWATFPAQLALFAGQTVTIRVIHSSSTNGQAYIDRIRVF